MGLKTFQRARAKSIHEEQHPRIVAAQTTLSSAPALRHYERRSFHVVRL